MPDPYQVTVQYMETVAVAWIYDPTLFSGAGGARPLAASDFTNLGGGGVGGGSGGAVTIANGQAVNLGLLADTAYTGIGFTGSSSGNAGDASLTSLIKGAWNLLNGTLKVQGIAGGVPQPVLQSGSTGLDYSANKPTLPNVGSNFAASGPYASYVLIETVPASAGRANVDIENISGAQIAVVRDDGTAASGIAPANASVFSLAGGNAAGAQGGSWSSATFKGRLQIYAASTGASVTVMVD